jgi:hypothetical protein
VEYGGVSLHGTSTTVEGPAEPGNQSSLKGHAYHMQKAGDIEGRYSDAIGMGAALVAGGGAARLRNRKGVVLELSGPRAGVELSLAMSRVVIRLR